ncbi:hypothetical protein [Clostridium lacusfryxellense]|uniref:hypothetical protein n=1 Tax=Clostridium lacusfryxellense TaxID=205328 RepID=UPI001C0C1FCC|nr:hypothetical protein [Clostridium lacusfryxellense]MBU3111079.1 hypothetical protein [Clostridium lacusfryxellense]
MICISCKNEFTNINGLKFCPYCGEKIDGKLNLEGEENPISTGEVDAESINKSDVNKKERQFTQAMPVISQKDINKYKRDKIFATFKNTFIKMKVIVPILLLLAIIGIGTFVYAFFIVKPVNDARIKDDLIGKVVTLPKGTSIKIDKDNIESFSIKSRNTEKSKDNIKLAVTFNNGYVEAKTILSLVYLDEGKNQWKASGGIVLDSLTSLKPVVGMDEVKFKTDLKKLSIPISDATVTLGDQVVKKLDISLRTPELENSKEEILVSTSIDSGIISSTGTIKCNLVFENEKWSIDTIDKNGIQKDDIENFKLVISKTFSDETVVKIISEHGLSETVVYPNLFDGKGFIINDKFTKNIKIINKKFDSQKNTLTVTANRQNSAGEIKSVLSTDYTFSMSFNKLSFLSGSKTTVDSGTVANISKEKIISTIESAEIQGSNLLFWWSNSHKITTEEAKTFKIDKTISKKGSRNIKYVYGSIDYVDKKKNENKNTSFVALYFLVYDVDNGYNWKLDKLYGEDSPNYDVYNKENEN